MVLRNKPDYFLRYYKNIQGAAAEANFGPPLVGLTGAFSQGVSNNIVGANGVVNPYGNATAPGTLNERD